MDPILVGMLVAGVTVLAAVAFVGWVAWKVALVVAWLVTAPLKLLAPPRQPKPPGVRHAGRCHRPDCAAVHPRGASFCPRCGVPLTALPSGTRYRLPPRRRLPLYA